MKFPFLDLKQYETPHKTEMYRFSNSRTVCFVEKQNSPDNLSETFDHVCLNYILGDGETGYYANEYRPHGVKKEGAKVIDITAMVENSSAKELRWHIYDVKDTLENTVYSIYEQWTQALNYLNDYVLGGFSGYKITGNLGVITRKFDSKRLDNLISKYEKPVNTTNVPLAQKKMKPMIPQNAKKLVALYSIKNKIFVYDYKGQKRQLPIKVLYLNNVGNGQSYKFELTV